MESTSKTKARNELFVAALIDVLQIIQQSAPAIDHSQQSPARVMILVMRTEVVGELADPGRQQCYLYLRRPGVVLSTTIFCKYLGFLFRTESHIDFLQTVPSRPIYCVVPFRTKPRILTKQPRVDQDLKTEKFALA